MGLCTTCSRVDVEIPTMLHSANFDVFRQNSLRPVRNGIIIPSTVAQRICCMSIDMANLGQ
jgi:hypothetical protein